jgi:hypothetical protein
MRHFRCSACGCRRFRLVVRRRGVELADGRKVTKLRKVCARCRPAHRYPPLCAACRPAKQARCGRCLAARAAIDDGTDEALSVFLAVSSDWTPCGGGRTR